MSTTLPPSLTNPWPRRQDFRRARNFYTAALSEVVREPLRRWGRSRSRCDPSPPRDWRRGLLLGPSHIGDVLYNTPSLPALAAGLPDCEWTYAVSGVSAQALEGNPAIKNVVVISEEGTLREKYARWTAVLAPYQFDAAVCYTGGPAWRETSLLLGLGIPNRVGYAHKGFSGLVTHPIALNFPQPYPAYFRDLVSQLTGPGTPPNPSLQPLVYLRPEHEEAADRAASVLGLDFNARPVLACSVTSRQPTGIWPEEQFFRTVEYVREQMPCTVVYTGAKSDAAQLQRLAERTGPNSFVLAGGLELLPMVALLRRCRAALTPDSGARHLANAAGIPVVFLRNLFNRKIETGAYCETDHDLSPDHLELVDTARQAAAFSAIDPRMVGAELVRLLQQA